MSSYTSSLGGSSSRIFLADFAALASTARFAAFALALLAALLLVDVFVAIASCQW
jgi:hypothetical protein